MNSVNFFSDILGNISSLFMPYFLFQILKGRVDCNFFSGNLRYKCLWTLDLLNLVHFFFPETLGTSVCGMWNFLFIYGFTFGVGLWTPECQIDRMGLCC